MNLYIKSAYSTSIQFTSNRSSEFMGKRKRKLACGSTFFALWLFFDHLGMLSGIMWKTILYVWLSTSEIDEGELCSVT